ncbi:hypothetical protein [Thermoanaerobacterium thermosaccharolyticum]|jgi:CRISPR-associated protein Csh1|uniref:hypothetical protein n=1 Tax=Thermoanaerobacterium thermosaccharolyticum TaxID=1517 RepID=UPI001781E6AC|nr:hypothetical protein [Thermoanaerobacterium thermosaccharolyticum]MBE0069910.1 hypothetical protein [Thermoanaerobacterium thermosaccharolyticum]MBE0228038.1 hypothetical protein [Thermoanaerobacterium thermosaccharolyticum]
MFYDLLDIYSKNNSTGNMAIDNYRLDDGLYIKINKNAKNVDSLLVDKNISRDSELYNWFKEADYYSKLIEMNKPVDPKKQIHSNNMYSLFIKHNKLVIPVKIFRKEKIKKYNIIKSKRKFYSNKSISISDIKFDDISISPTFRRNVDRYFDSLKNMDERNYKFIKSFGLNKIDTTKADESKKIILDNRCLILKTIKKHNIKKDIYIKIFIEGDINNYKIESIRYIAPKIFNTNEYNIDFNNEIYGLSNVYMGLNQKKPFLEHKTTSFAVPFRIKLNEALESRDMEIWIENQYRDDGKAITSGYISVKEEQFGFNSDINDRMSCTFIKFEKGADTQIIDYDFLPGANNKIKPFKLENYLELDLEYFNAESISDRKKLEMLIDDWLYNKNLIKNYYNEKPKANNFFSARQVDLLIISRDAMHNFFRKSDDNALKSCIDNVSLRLIKEAVLRNQYKIIEKTNIAKAINLRLALLKYFKVEGKEDMGDKILYSLNTIKSKILNDSKEQIVTCDSDEEFYFGLGQLVRYLTSQSQAEKINYNIIDPILNARDYTKIKEETINLIKKYSHALNVKSLRLNNLISMLMGYEPENRDVIIDAFLAGFASKNIIYSKGEDHNGNEK